MIVKYKYRGTYGTSAWFVADQEDAVKVFKYDSVTWMLMQRLDTGEVRMWNSDSKRWRPAGKFLAMYLKQFDD